MGEVDELMAKYPTRATSAAPIPYFFHDGVVEEEEEVWVEEKSLPVRGSASSSVYYDGMIILLCSKYSVQRERERERERDLLVM